MDETTLKKAFHALERAYQEGDVAGFLAGHDLGGTAGEVRTFLPDFGAPLGEPALRDFVEFATALPGAGWILPRNVLCQVIGDVGIVSYTFATDEHELGRGTRVFRWVGGGWKCVHTHLSTAPDVRPPLPGVEAG